MDKHDSEQQRIEALRQLMLLDTSEEKAYDDITRMAATVCRTPIALISLIDSDRQWFKSKVGLAASQTPREHAFCAHAIDAPGAPLIVEDARQDSRFANNPLVTGDPNIRFYAGAPLVTTSGQAIGTLCVIDSEPRTMDPQAIEQLKFMAEQVIEIMESRARLPRIASG
ncbi:MAG: GAF domain-containing protein [Gammaproteobacteria bacterium]|nr:GAF domain-containing protein [Gammaproteobacteria bacterium]MBU1441651.1 GAF domain-containing protein [Gammaproteobacteria bacterium]MBU2407195.1 GAF domain-containing protein [Gammaproteobacteria bacterium]